jgi:zinc protease
MIIAAVGDIDSQEIANKVSQYFSGWKTSPLSINKVQVTALPLATTKREIEMKDKTSVDVYIGQSIGIDRNHGDFHSLYVAVFVLGGNFSARLVIRKK